MSIAPALNRTTPRLTAPFFEIGPKNLLRLPELVLLAQAAETVGRASGVTVVLSVPVPLISSVRAAAPGILVFAQDMHADEPGASVGRTIAEALADAGASGVLLNHDSNPLEPSVLPTVVRRAHSNGLLTMVCAGTEPEVLQVAALRPATVLFEPPELIGASGQAARPWIEPIDAQVHQREPGVLMMHAGGVASADDVYSIMRAGAAGTGSTSGILQADLPVEAMTAFIQAAREGFDARRREGRSS